MYSRVNDASLLRVCACNTEHECKNKERDPCETDLGRREREKELEKNMKVFTKKRRIEISLRERREGFSER